MRTRERPFLAISGPQLRHSRVTWCQWTVDTERTCLCETSWTSHAWPHNHTTSSWLTTFTRLQSCPWVYFVWHDPTQPVSWLTKPNLIHCKWEKLDPTQPNTTNNGAYTFVVTYFYAQNLSRTFSLPSINVFTFFTDHYTYRKQCHYVTQKQDVQRNVQIVLSSSSAS